jgi:hypothetical protein
MCTGPSISWDLDELPPANQCSLSNQSPFANRHPLAEETSPANQSPLADQSLVVSQCRFVSQCQVVNQSLLSNQCSLSNQFPFGRQYPFVSHCSRGNQSPLANQSPIAYQHPLLNQAPWANQSSLTEHVSKEMESMSAKEDLLFFTRQFVGIRLPGVQVIMKHRITRLTAQNNLHSVIDFDFSINIQSIDLSGCLLNSQGMRMGQSHPAPTMAYDQTANVPVPMGAFRQARIERP